MLISVIESFCPLVLPSWIYHLGYYALPALGMHQQSMSIISMNQPDNVVLQKVDHESNASIICDTLAEYFQTEEGGSIRTGGERTHEIDKIQSFYIVVGLGSVGAVFLHVASSCQPPFLMHL